MNPKDWLDRISGGTSVNAAAAKADVPQKTLDTQMRSPKGLRPEMIIKLARAYTTSPVAALVEFGYLKSEEVKDGAAIVRALKSMRAAESLEHVSDDQLLTEIGTRLAARKKEADRAATVRALPMPTMDELELADSAAAPVRPDIEGDEEPPLP